MELIEKARLLGELWRVDPDGEVSEWATLGMPYAFGVVNGDILSLSAHGEMMIEQAWSRFVDVYGLDPAVDYSGSSIESLLDMFD